jgi:choline-phosphate cytidylyltransferase
MRVITFGTFDLYHVGHVNVFDIAGSLGDEVIVGVSSDQLNMHKKGHFPIIPQDQRIKMVASHKAVTEVFVEESLELKRHYITKYRADILLMGDDWSGKFDHLSDTCQVIYCQRTPCVSTTEILEKINKISSQ